MATANPSILSAHNAGRQELYTITTVTNTWKDSDVGVPRYDSIGPYASVAFDTTDIDIGANISTADGVAFSLSGGLTYTITASTNLVNGVTSPSNPVVLVVFDTTTFETVGQPRAITGPLITSYTPASDTVITISASYWNGQDWQYPALLENSEITIQAVDGYTV